MIVESIGERDLFVTSEVVIWSFESEEHGTVFAVTHLCDENGNIAPNRLPRVKTQNGEYYKHDDWKTGATIEEAIAEYCGDDENCKQRITSQMRSLQ